MFLLTFVITGFSTVLAQQTTALKFEALTNRDGLSQGFVSGITQDKKGFMWFATLDGLNRYDGYHFIVYRHNELDKNSIASNFVFSPFEDSHQRLWISTWDNGLDYFDRQHQKFYHFFQGNYFRYVLEDKQGNLWTIMNDSIIVRMSVRNIKTQKAGDLPFVVDTTQIVMYNSSRASICIDDKNDVYVAASNTLYKLIPAVYNKYTLKAIYYPAASASPKLLFDTFTHKYYLQSSIQLLEFSNNKFQKPDTIFKTNDVPAIIDNSHQLWYCNTYLDVNPFEPQINLITRNYKKIIPTDNSYGKFLAFTYVIYQDKNGTLWFGSSGFGILKYSTIINRFNLVKSTSEQSFFNLYKVRDSGIQAGFNTRFWISKQSTVRTDSFKVKFDYDPSKIYYTTDYFLANHIYAVDSTGDHWIGSADNLIQYNPFLQKIIKIIPVQSNTNKLLSDKINALQKQQFVFERNAVTNLYGLFTMDNYVCMFIDDLFISYNINAKAFAAYPLIKRIKNSFVTQLNYYKDNNGFLWMNTDNGCYCLNLINGNVKQYLIKDKITSIESFCDDVLQPSKYIWLGTASGIKRLNKLTGAYNNFYHANLPNSIVYGILSDSLNNLWMSSNAGLYRMHLPDFKVDHFDESDGLQSDEFNSYSYLKMNNRLLVFGGADGLNYFNPNDIEPANPPAVIITDFRQAGKSTNLNNADSLFAQTTTYTNNIIQKYSRDVIDIEFAGVDYNKKGKLTYRYQLKGFDNGWNYSGKNNIATYTNLDPGHYNFIVEASSNNNDWGPSNNQLHLHIKPLWWQTLLFKAFVVFLFLALAYSIYKYRLQQALQIEKVRNRIASDLHDEIGSTLSTITIYSRVAQNQLISTTETTQPAILLQKISDDTTEAMEAMKDIVWSINTKNDNFNNIITRMQAQALHLLETKQYDVHFDVGKTVHKIKLAMQKRRDFYLIFKEAINNIAKHAYGKNVWVKLYEKNNYLFLIIKDDGKGFDEKHIRQGANGLQNMKAKAADINGKIKVVTSETGEGTTLELSFLFKN